MLLRRLLATCALSALPGVVVAQVGAEGVSEGEVVQVDDSIRGWSGKLLARFVGARRDGPVRILQALFGDSASRRPGVYRAASGTSSLSLITLLPFRAKVAGRIGSYRVGNWPNERRGNAHLPEGFIEVTESNQDTPLSPHFRLRDFLTKDQPQVWPKYLVLKEALVDKLELVIEDMRARGYRVNRMAVLSGFRTPQYNAAGVRRGGRASDSRHQYGDAADVYVDNDNDGRMDDLNGDGRVNSRDTRIILESVERVERSYPSLVGGTGLYGATGAHAGFVHIDVRGTLARWGGPS